VAEETEMRQQLLSGGGEFGCHCDGRPGVIWRKPRGSVQRVFNVVALPPQSAMPVERGAALSPDTNPGRVGWQPSCADTCIVYWMTIMRDVRELSVTEAAKRGVAGLVAEAERGADLVVTRRNHPVAAVVGIGRLALLESAESDLRDLALVLARTATDTGRRTSLDDVLSAFGHTRESLAELPEDD
jgi:prevent-host-death family protein